MVAELDWLKVAKRIGSLPENMNFGIKASVGRQFLSASGLPTKWSKRSKSYVHKGTGQDCTEADRDDGVSIRELKT